MTNSMTIDMTNDIANDIAKTQESPLFTIRPATEKDFGLLTNLFASENMPIPSHDDLKSGTVAVNNNDEPVGFIRILTVHDAIESKGSGNYVYPVVVFAHWRGYGVARALCEYELQQHGKLKLVACRASREFYPKAGFEAESWDNISSVIAQDCKQCPDLDSCNPQPFSKRIR